VPTHLHLLYAVHLVPPEAVKQLTLDALAVVGGLALSVDHRQHVLLVVGAILDALQTAAQAESASMHTRLPDWLQAGINVCMID
jgi:hypothetical protein